MKSSTLLRTFAVASLIVPLSSCSVDEICPGIYIPAVIAEVRDASGQPAAKGTTVTVTKPGYEATSLGFDDPLRVEVGDQGGTFTVTATKPFYESTTVENVQVPEGECGAADSTVVDLTVTLEPDAPPVRQVVFYEYSIRLSGGDSVRRIVYVDADPTVSREVTWNSADESVATVDPEGRITGVCRDSSGSTTVTATSVVDETKSDSIRVTVEAASDSNLCP